MLLPNQSARTGRLASGGQSPNEDRWWRSRPWVFLIIG